MNLGGTIADHTTVTGVDGSGLPTGTVAFYVCGPTTANTLCASTANRVGTASVPASSDTGFVSSATSSTYTPTSAGIYCFASVFTPEPNTTYAGSTDNQSGTVENSECVNVVSATPGGGTTTTTQPPAGSASKPAASAPLAFTGAWMVAEMKWAIALVLLGAAFVIIARRRNKRIARNR